MNSEVISSLPHDRLAALEQAVASLRHELSEVRAIVLENCELLSNQSDARYAEFLAARARLEELEEDAMYTLFRVFPKQCAFLDEVDAIIRPRKR